MSPPLVSLFVGWWSGIILGLPDPWWWTGWLSQNVGN